MEIVIAASSLVTTRIDRRRTQSAPSSTIDEHHFRIAVPRIGYARILPSDSLWLAPIAATLPPHLPPPRSPSSLDTVSVRFRESSRLIDTGARFDSPRLLQGNTRNILRVEAMRFGFETFTMLYDPSTADSTRGIEVFSRRKEIEPRRGKAAAKVGALAVKRDREAALDVNSWMSKAPWLVGRSRYRSTGQDTI